jgi:hypothetical protein
MVKLYAVELVLEGPHSIAVRLHLVVVAARVLHDLVDHKLRVPPDVEALDARLDGDSEAAEKGLVLCHVVDAGKCRRTAYLMCSPRGEMKSRPAPAPVFITDPSK